MAPVALKLVELRTTHCVNCRLPIHYAARPGPRPKAHPGECQTIRRRQINRDSTRRLRNRALARVLMAHPDPEMRRGYRSLTPKEIGRLIHMRDRGVSVEALAGSLGVSTRTIYRYADMLAVEMLEIAGWTAVFGARRRGYPVQLTGWVRIPPEQRETY